MRRSRTVADSTTNETGQREEAIEDTVRGIREGNVLSPTGTEVVECAEHAWRTEAGEPHEEHLRCWPSGSRH